MMQRIDLLLCSARSAILAILAATLLVACTSQGGGSDSTDTTAPTATVSTNAPSVPDPGLIRNDTVITITFSESMDTKAGAWTLGGDLAGESDGGVWGATASENDTLTVSPAGGGAWFAKPDRTLTLSARDLAGNPVAPLALSYDVCRGTLYFVDVRMPDNNGDGLTPATARKFIHTAVANALVPATVLVMAGEYRLSNELNTQVVLQNGVSLYGGYNDDFSVRDPALYVAAIPDRSTTGGTAGSPRAAVVGDGNAIGPDTVVDGFTILGTFVTAGGNVCYGWNIEANAPADCPPTATLPAYTAAIALLNGASPTLQNNVIHGGGGTGVTFSSGVFNDENANPAIHDNTIHGGSTSNTSNGITDVNSSPMIQNNTIYSGDGTSAHGIFDSGGTTPPANPDIENNIIFTRSGSGTYCVYGTGPDSNPASLRNNDLWNCAVVLQEENASCVANADGDNNANTCALAEVNVLTGIPGGTSGNISANPLFADIDGPDNNGNTVADNDWHLSPASPFSVTSGGLNGILEGWTFTTAKDGVARPPSGFPWSIGAYEP